MKATAAISRAVQAHTTPFHTVQAAFRHGPAIHAQLVVGARVAHSAINWAVSPKHHPLEEGLFGTPDTETDSVKDGLRLLSELDAVDDLQLSGSSQSDVCDALLPCRLRGGPTARSRLSVQDERRGGQPETDAASDPFRLSTTSLWERLVVGCASPPSRSTEFLAARLRGTPATDCSGWPRFDILMGSSQSSRG